MSRTTSMYDELGGSGDWAAVTPNDSADLPNGISRGVYVGVSGDITAVTEMGQTVTFVSVVAGLVHPLKLRRIRATGTDATDILVCY